MTPPGHPWVFIKNFGSRGPAVVPAICNTYLYKCLFLYICIWKLYAWLRSWNWLKEYICCKRQTLYFEDYQRRLLRWYLQGYKFYLKSLPPSLLKKLFFPNKWFLEKVNEFLFSEMGKNSWFNFHFSFQIF